MRHEMELSQSKFAELIETHARNFKTGEKPTVSVDTIKNLEYGKLKLSEDMAERIAGATGISMEWLDGNDRKAPKTGYTGEQWSKAWALRKHAAPSINGNDAEKLQHASAVRTAAFAVRCITAVLAGCADNPLKFDAAKFRLARFLESMKEDFGWNAEAYDRGSAAFNVAERRFQKASERHWKSLSIQLANAARAQGWNVKLAENQIEARMTKTQEAAVKRRLKKRERARNQANTGTRASS